MTATHHRKNPFKGAYALDEGDQIFGRERERAELFQLLVARRILVLHAPSGAGKTSLVRAGLIPDLEKDDFKVLPIARVVQAVGATVHNSEVNRYTYLCMHAMEETRSKHETKKADEDLPARELNDYLKTYENAAETLMPMVLIIDQFEEVFKNPIDIDEKEQFFYQLGKSLRNPYLWALFIIRDDYMGVLRDKRYTRPVPTQFSNTYHLDLLEVERAKQAIRKTAALDSRRFAPDALDKLVKDLVQIRVQQPDGSSKEQDGLYVEPVQLQVVCEQLWKKLSDEDETITLPILQEHANVDDALGTFYDSTVRSIAKAHSVEERSIRDWFQNELTTPQNLRGQAMSSGNLDQTTVNELINAHLVRGEVRRNIRWYELAHDRLVRPVRHSNEIWYEENLHFLQRRAEAWNRLPDNGLLLQSELLEEAASWARGRKLADHEQSFLSASQARERARKRMRRWRNLISALIAGLLILVLIFWLRAENSRIAADEARKVAIDQKATAVAARGRQIELRVTAQYDRTVALRAETKANVAQHEAEVARDEAEVSRDEAESRRLADVSEVELDDGNLDGALLLARLAVLSMNTEAAIEALQTAFEARGRDISEGAPFDWLEVTCELAGRNLTLDEWERAFGEQPYQITCTEPDYGVHISVVEEILLRCDGIAEARERYAVAQKPEDNGTALEFSEWALPLLLGQAVVEADESRARACLRTAQENDILFDRVAFMQVKENLAGLNLDFSSDSAAQSIFRRVQSLDDERKEWPAVVSAAFDGPLSNYYRELCTNLAADEGTEGAKEACTRFNQIVGGSAALAHMVPMTRTVSTGTTRTYAFNGNYGDLLNVVVEVSGDGEKPSYILRDVNGNLIRNQEAEAGTLSNVVLPASDRYHLELQWSSSPPHHSLSMSLTKPEVISLGAAVDATADARIWQLEGGGGELVTIAMDARGLGDPVLRLRDNQGNEIAYNDDFGGSRNSRIQVRLPSNNRHFFIEAGWFGNSTPVPYRLAVSPVEHLRFGEEMVEASGEALEWAFNGDGGDFVTISVRAVEENSIQSLSLLDEERNVLSTTSVGRGGVATLSMIRLPNDGIYFISPGSSTPSGNFQISLDTVEVFELAAGETIPRASADQRIWAFEGESDVPIVISMEAVNRRGVPFLRLTDEFGNVITSAERGIGHGALLCGVMLPTDGRYLLEVGWFEAPGPYRLSLTASEPNEIEISDSVEGVSVEQCQWQFNGDAGDFVSITMSANDSDGDPSLALRNEAGDLLLSDDGDDTPDTRLEMVLPADGQYIIDASWDAEPGLYSLSLEEVQVGPIAIDETLENINPGQSGWQFEGNSGDVVTISLEALDPAGIPRLYLYNASGEVIDIELNAEQELQAALNAILPADETYIIHAGWLGSPVPYTLSLQRAVAEPMRLPETVAESDPGQSLWQFEGNPGDYVTIAMNALEEGGDPLLRLYAADGRFLQQNDDYDGRNSRIQFILPESGAYIVEAGWYSNPGRYELELREDELVTGIESASILREHALLFIERGYVAAGLELLREVEDIESTSETALLSARDYNNICWFGSLWRFAREVFFACEIAVEREPDNVNYKDSRGVARAMTGDFEGAIEDFEAYVDAEQVSNPSLRETWIVDLRARRNPFADDALLMQLRNGEN